MNRPKTKTDNIVVQKIEKEILIYDLQTNKAFCLNETSAIIYNLCNGKKSVAEISRILTKQLNQPITEDLIWLALDDFKKDNLLEESERFEINFNGLSRRQVIRKIGFASLATLPVIASLTAPAAGGAASFCIPLNQSCTTPFTMDNCCPGTFCCGTPICVATVCANCSPSGVAYVGANQAVCNSQAALCCSGTATFNGTFCRCN